MSDLAPASLDPGTVQARMDALAAEAKARLRTKDRIGLTLVLATTITTLIWVVLGRTVGAGLIAWLLGILLGLTLSAAASKFLLGVRDAQSWTEHDYYDHASNHDLPAHFKALADDAGAIPCSWVSVHVMGPHAVLASTHSNRKRFLSLSPSMTAPPPPSA